MPRGGLEFQSVVFFKSLMGPVPRPLGDRLGIRPGASQTAAECSVQRGNVAVGVWTDKGREALTRKWFHSRSPGAGHIRTRGCLSSVFYTLSFQSLEGRGLSADQPTQAAQVMRGANTIYSSRTVRPRPGHSEEGHTNP